MSKLHTRHSSWYGWLPDLPDHRDLRYAAIRPRAAKLPKAVDLRPGCSKIENQGAIGSCTANALAGAIEFLDRKSGASFADRSRLFIYYNERAIEGSVGSDSGAFLRDGIKSLAKQGVCDEIAWPYLVSKYTKKPTAACYTAAKKHKIVSYHRISGVDEMRACLAEGFPFVFGFTVYSAFESDAVANSGNLSLPKANESVVGGHAVLAVGYDDTKKRLLVRNSWGTAWGMKGYFTMPYAYVGDSNLADDFWAIRQSK